MCRSCPRWSVRRLDGWWDDVPVEHWSISVPGAFSGSRSMGIEWEVRRMMLFLGDDWAEAHHDVELVDEAGRVLAKRRLPEGVKGLAGLHELVAEHLGDDDEPATRGGRDRDRPRPVGERAGRGRVHGVRGQPAAGGPLPGAALGVGGEVRPRRRAHPGRDRAPGPGAPPPAGRGLDVGRADQGAGPLAPDDDLDPPAAGQPAALHAAGVLPGRAGHPRRRSDRPGRGGGAGRRPRPRRRAKR